MQVSEKNMENSERLVRQARLGIEPGTSRLPDLERKTAQQLAGPRMDNFTSCITRDSNPGSFVQQPAPLQND